MITEDKGNLFNEKTDAICITTNGMTKKNGELVMGAGVAKQAAKLYPWLPITLGDFVRAYGNHPGLVTSKKQPITRIDRNGNLGRGACLVDAGTTLPYEIVSFPTKNDWKDDSTLALIEESAKSLLEIAEVHGWSKVSITRPGCGNGGLDWRQVKPVLEKIWGKSKIQFNVIAPFRTFDITPT